MERRKGRDGGSEIEGELREGERWRMETDRKRREGVDRGAAVEEGATR